MTTLFTKIQSISGSTNLDELRDELAQISINFNVVDSSVRDFAFLLAIAEENIAEVALGVLVRRLMNYKQEDINYEILWLLLAAVLSRSNITSNSALRISLLGIASHIQDWELPIFALLVIALDTFLRNSIETEDCLVSEQTLDFIAAGGENYAKAPRTLEQVAKLNSLGKSVLDQVNEPILKEEWSEGLDLFFNAARKAKYSDQRIWSSSGELLKKFYPAKTLENDKNSDNNRQVYNNISRLITSSLAAVGTVFCDEGLSIAVHIDNPEKNNFWSVVASAIDKLERLFQELADVTFERQVRLPTFTPAQAIPGSWTIILHIGLSSNQSSSIAREIASLSSTEYEQSHVHQDVVDSWRECVELLQEDNLRVDLAVASKNIEFSFLPSLSTEDFVDLEKYEKNNIRVLSHDVPQANNIERILELSSLFIQYSSSIPIIRDKFLEINKTTRRDYSYHRRASEILGLVDWRGHPTKTCDVLIRLTAKDAQMRLLAYQFITSNVGSAWLVWQNANDLSEINADSAEEFLTEACPSLSEKTIERRSQTLKSWLNEFLPYW